MFVERFRFCFRLECRSGAAVVVAGSATGRGEPADRTRRWAENAADARGDAEADAARPAADAGLGRGQADGVRAVIKRRARRLLRTWPVRSSLITDRLLLAS